MSNFSNYKDKEINKYSRTNLQNENNPYFIFEDPNRIGFRLFFHFDQEDSGLLGTEYHVNSALYYLNSIGDKVRFQYLKNFIQHLKNLNTYTPWFFREIQQLDAAWERNYSAPLLKDRKLGIGVSDTIDMRAIALIDLYRKACFDWENRREVVPWNLRTFNMKVWLYDPRTFTRPIDEKDITNIMLGDNPFGDNPQDYGINAYTNRVMYEFQLCEILPDESKGIFATVSNSEPTNINFNIGMSYKNVLEHNLYNLYGADLVDKTGTIRVNVPAILDNISKFGAAKKQLIDAADSLVSDIANKYVLSKVKSLLLGNVYGFSLANTVGNVIAGPQGVVNAISDNSKKNNTRIALPPVGNILNPPINNSKDVDFIGNNNEGVSILNNSTLASGNNIQGQSLNNNSTSTSGNNVEGASLNNINGQASGNIVEGPSLNNDSGDTSGNNVEGASLNNDSGDTSGNNVEGPSLNNNSKDTSGNNTEGQSLNNNSKDTSGNNVEGPSLNNINGQASGNNVEGPSLNNINGQASGNNNTGPSLRNNGSSVDGNVNSGISLQNTNGIAKGNNNSGVSLGNNSSIANGQISGGRSLSNIEKLASGKVYKDIEPNQKPIINKLEEGKSVNNINSLPSGNVNGPVKNDSQVIDKGNVNDNILGNYNKPIVTKNIYERNQTLNDTNSSINDRK